MRPNVMIMKGPGTNCEVETAHAFEIAGANTEIVHMSQMESGEKRIDIVQTQMVVWAGGFSYGDDIKSGQVMAIEAETRFGDQLQDFYDRDGMMLGVCNGYQILVRSGLLPYGNIFEKQKDMTLTDNKNGHFVSRWIDMKVNGDSNSLWLPDSLMERFTLHSAHAEGQHVFGEGVYEELQESGQIALQYIDPEGHATTDQPYNPNGSVYGVAGISDPKGTILGLMPHPERLREIETHPHYHQLKAQGQAISPAGLAIIKTGVNHVIAA